MEVRLIDQLSGHSVITKKHPLDIVLFCGSPGAGKSTFYWKYLKHLGYERVNQDILKTVCGIPNFLGSLNSGLSMKFGTWSNVDFSFSATGVFTGLLSI